MGFKKSKAFEQIRVPMLVKMSNEDGGGLAETEVARAQSRLPAVVKPPVLMAPYSSLSRVLKVGLTSKTLSQMELSEAALWTIRPRLITRIWSAFKIVLRRCAMMKLVRPAIKRSSAP